MSSDPLEGLSAEDRERLLKAYRQSLPQRLAALETAVVAAQSNPSFETLSALRMLVHKMAGNAGAYGYPAVTDVCRAWDRKLAEAMDRGGADPSLLAGLGELLPAIQRGFGKDGS